MALTNLVLQKGNQPYLAKKEEKRWNELIDAVMRGDVIPVIGPDLLVDDESDGSSPSSNLHKQIIDLLAAHYGVESQPQTFSQLVYDKDFIYETNSDKEAIYGEINDILSQAQDENLLKPSNILLRLLKLRKFPFVITTSFTPLVEMAMQEAWPGKEVRVLEFRNDPNFDLMAGKGDITNETDMTQPTVYYMFGKYSNQRRYVVTDIDMMDFCRKWIAGNGVPRVLTEVIKKRYLLVLGNNYSDWLFRFIWYSMRPTTDSMRSSLMVHNKLDPTLRDFLDRLQTFIEKDPNYVVAEIERRVKEREQHDSNNRKHYETDVFLSYSHRDKDIVGKIYGALSKAGLRVWYDSNDIPGGADWKQTFLNGVRQTRLFVPVLSSNVAKEFLEPHEYRDEWNLAASMASKMGGCDFIWPLAERGFDFYSQTVKLPEQFAEKNASWYDIADDFATFAAKIKQRVDEKKQIEEELTHGN